MASKRSTTTKLICSPARKGVGGGSSEEASQEPTAEFDVRGTEGVWLQHNVHGITAAGVRDALQGDHADIPRRCRAILREPRGIKYYRGLLVLRRDHRVQLLCRKFNFCSLDVI